MCSHWWIKDEKMKSPDQKVESANSLIFRVASVSSILKQNGEVFPFSESEFRKRTGKSGEYAQKERTIRRNTKAKAKKLRKSLQEKRRANKQRKTWVALRSVNEQNTWASLHHFSHISRRKYPSKPLAHSILDRTELSGSPLLKHSEFTRCSELNKQTQKSV